MKKYDLQFHENKTDPTALSVQLSGELTLESVAGIKDEFLKKSSSKQNLELLITDVEEMDLSFYQFLLSISKTLIKQKKNIKIQLSLPAELEELFRKSGFDLNFN
jgi:anti-anti-sigma regulatory factor